MPRGFSMDAFAQVFGAETGRAMRELQHDLRRSLEKAALAEAQAEAPVAEGEFRDSLEIVPGRVRVGKISSDAAHAQIIERGRKRGITPRGQKRVRQSRAKGAKKLKPNPKAPMLGSRQAPRGLSRPVRDRLNARIEQIVADPLKKFEDKIGSD